jgi:phosphatidate phosphatase PAH1
MLKATDSSENSGYYTLSFFIDSKDPSISKTTPKTGFISNQFYIEFTELNASSLTLYYGNSSVGNRTHNVSLDECQVISSKSGKYNCSINVPMSDYNGKQIFYWYNLTDIAGNYDTSSTVKKITVDTTPPEITNFTYSIDKKKLTTNISVIEENFDEIEYYDFNADRPRWNTFCSSLKKSGNCLKSISFDYGEHNLQFKIVDEAGNEVYQNLTVTI